jgi:hypothetical protein
MNKHYTDGMALANEYIGTIPSRNWKGIPVHTMLERLLREVKRRMGAGQTHVEIQPFVAGYHAAMDQAR